jgi:hypothetical protein
MFLGGRRHDGFVAQGDHVLHDGGHAHVRVGGAVLFDWFFHAAKFTMPTDDTGNLISK